MILKYSRLPNKHTGYVYQFSEYFPGGWVLFGGGASIHGLLYFLWINYSFQKFQENAIFLKVFQIPARRQLVVAIQS